ncbi:hypothetical protein [Nannocystis sp. SCPEA4]|uniref:hypothetical protein n=1 Tax=Nannocystis sp. SCPEA4 TaxID=2996787 RepID=UPI002270C0C0|nr:hypothetical protein [Nannocystis sp. SCPEA4]MCY1060167.1 hypothetical protein [Nannocystis sp. SCPEA4]
MHDGAISVYAPQALNPHEIAHALHYAVLPPSKRFLHEGFAMLFNLEGSAVAGYDEAMHWDDTAILDDLLSEWDDSYYEPAFQLVSWIIQRHGMSRFKEFWRSVARDASAAEVRAAYDSVFGESIEAMIAAQIAAFASACTIPLCDDQAPIPWNGDRWSFSAPFACEDDSTIGPLTQTHPLGVRLVHLDVPTTGRYRIEANGAENGGAILAGCTPSCPTVNSFVLFNGPPHERELQAGRYELALHRRYGPDDPPPAVTIEYLGPP